MSSTASENPRGAITLASMYIEGIQHPDTPDYSLSKALLISYLFSSKVSQLDQELNP